MTRLCSIYTRDVLSFLDYAQLQQCRLVSCSMNGTIVNHPVSLPARRRFDVLKISVERAAVRFDEDGYADLLHPHRVYIGSIIHNSRQWKEVQAEWGCCRDELEVGGSVRVMLEG